MEITNGTKKQISEHFNAYEFKCKCGGNHKIVIQDELIELLEKLRSELGASSCNIYSGYRCSKHDKSVGGSGSGPHTKGYAVDCYFIKDGKRISSKDVALKLEDMGHKYGIGYRCGGSKPETGQTHIDVKHRKWYGDESVSMNKSCCSSFYEYFGIKGYQSYQGTFPSLRLGIYGWKKGDKGNKNIGYIQSFLNWYYDCGLKVDNNFGIKTTTQVCKFQKEMKITQDGKVGKNTIAKMKSVKK